MNSELNKIAKWFQHNQLSLNVGKTQFMIFSKRKVNVKEKVQINGTLLEQVSQASFLGIIVDDKLSWKAQINQVNKKVSKSIGILYKVRHVFSKSLKLKIYNTFVLPHLTYCNIVWASAYPTYLKPIEVTQKRAIKITLGVPIDTSTEMIFERSRLLPIATIHNIQTSIFMFKYHVNVLPKGFKNMFITNRDIHSHNTRSTDLYHIPKC